MRARLPDESGDVDRDGVRIHWDRYGEGDVTVLLLPTWSIIPSRHWKFQVPYLARHHRIVTFDGRGSGRSDRPVGPTAYTRHEYVADTVAVLDATGVERAVVVALSRGAGWAFQLAADHGDRVLGICAIAPAAPVTTPQPSAMVHSFDAPLDHAEGWAKFNRHYWRRDYAGFLRFFFAEMFSEPHSTKQIVDGIGWASQVDVETLIDTQATPPGAVPVEPDDLYSKVSCPVLVVHGDEDRLRHHATGVAIADSTGGDFVTVAGAGHAPHMRDPVFVNRTIRAFVEQVTVATRPDAIVGTPR
jgi:pimeloyl-ACP methyl ester carboxylesterase